MFLSMCKINNLRHACDEVLIAKPVMTSMPPVMTSMPTAACKRWQTPDWPLAVVGSDGNAKAGNSIVKLDREKINRGSA
jgi:hypothetical protein